MISIEQMDRAVTEFTKAAEEAFGAARAAEVALENYTYRVSSRDYDPQRRAELAKAYHEADYMAESRAWIRELVKAVLTAEKGARQ